jgi:cathepsin L
MKKFIIFVFLVVLAVLAASEELKKPETKRGVWRKRNVTPEEKQKFREWRQKFRKHYKSEAEEVEGMKKLAVNKEEIDKHNKLFKQGEKTFKRGLWEHSDLAPEDKAKYLHGVIPEAAARSLPAMASLPQYPPGPDSLDWRTHGLVGPVEDQGLCGSCWTFGAKGVVESLLRKKNITDPLASQQLVDCVQASKGCKGGSPKLALDYMKDNGFTTDKSYPYFGYQRNCTYNKNMTLQNGFINETFVLWPMGKLKLKFHSTTSSDFFLFRNRQRNMAQVRFSIEMLQH